MSGKQRSGFDLLAVGRNTSSNTLIARLINDSPLKFVRLVKCIRQAPENLTTTDRLPRRRRKTPGITVNRPVAHEWGFSGTTTGLMRQIVTFRGESMKNKRLERLL